MSTPKSEEVVFLRPTFEGARFDAGLMPVDALGELSAYHRILVAVAKALFKGRHPGRQRVPRGFEGSLVLGIRHVDSGSACPVLLRAMPKPAPPAAQTALALVPGEVEESVPDYFDEAQQLVLQLVARSSLPAEFPKSVVSMFNSFGASLRKDERIRLAIPGGSTAVYDRRKRKEIVLLRAQTYEDTVEETGMVTMINSERMSFELSLDDGSRVPGRMTAETFEAFREVVGQSDLRVRILGTGLRDGADRLVSIDAVDEVALHQDEDHVSALDIGQRLAVLAQLEEGWLHGNGAAIDAPILEPVTRILTAMVDQYGTPRPYLYPTAEGRIEAEWTFPDAEVSVEFGVGENQAEFHALTISNGADRESRVPMTPHAAAADRLARLVALFAPQASIGVSP